MTPPADDASRAASAPSASSSTTIPSPPDEALPHHAAVAGLDEQGRRLRRMLPYIAIVFGMWAIVLLALVWQKNPEYLPPLGLSIGALFSGGKEASIPLGAGYGVPATLVGFTVFLVDVAAVAILFPILIRGMDHVESTKGFFGEMLRVARKQADKRRKWVDRWGVGGLYLFSIVPFAFNGPPQGIVLGRLAGLRPSQIALAIAGAMVTTTVAWTMVAHYAREWLATVNPKLPLYLSVGITAAVIIVAVVGVIRERRAAKAIATTK